MTASDLDLLKTRLRELAPKAPPNADLFTLVEAVAERLEGRTVLYPCDCTYGRDGTPDPNCRLCGGLGAVAENAP
jgi:hypothetical protein